MSHCIVPEFFCWTEPIARKEHKCCECFASIRKGEKHFHGRGCWEGNFNEYRQHLSCMEACMLIRDEMNEGECIDFGALKEWLGEASILKRRYYQPRTDADKRLRSLVAKILWRERRERTEA